MRQFRNLNPFPSSLYFNQTYKTGILPQSTHVNQPESWPSAHEGTHLPNHGPFRSRITPASERPEKTFPYPELQPHHVENAKLFAGRDSLVKHWAAEFQNGKISEVGVMFGDFSDVLLRTFEPQLFIAIDDFQMHTVPFFWGKPSAETFKGMTHRELYEKRFNDRGKQVKCEEGISWEALARFPDQTFDIIYIDAGHDYQSVKNDAAVATQKIQPNGLLVFNDYIKYSHYNDQYYGVIPVVNELVANQGFEIVGFALQADMYCDVAIKKRNSNSIP